MIAALAFVACLAVLTVRADEEFCVPSATFEFASNEVEGMRYSNGFNTASRVFVVTKLNNMTDQSSFRCECLQLCEANAQCAHAFIVNNKTRSICYGLRNSGNAVATKIQSESWAFRSRTTTTVRTTLMPYTPPQSSCVSATLRFSSSVSGGMRFSNAIAQRARSFEIFKLFIETSRDQFRCDCLQRCFRTTNCRSAFIQTGKIGFLCYGLTTVNLGVQSSLVSESWVLDK
jgi:hypothetical protein